MNRPILFVLDKDLHAEAAFLEPTESRLCTLERVRKNQMGWYPCWSLANEFFDFRHCPPHGRCHGLHIGLSPENLRVVAVAPRTPLASHRQRPFRSYSRIECCPPVRRPRQL